MVMFPPVHRPIQSHRTFPSLRRAHASSRIHFVASRTRSPALSHPIRTPHHLTSPILLSQTSVPMSRLFRRWTSTSRPSIHVPLTNTGLILHTLGGGLLLHTFFTYCYQFRLTQGSSMMPTFEEFGTWVLVNPYYRRGRGVQVGDCVTYKHPFIQGVGGLKRVVGMPGDFVLMGTPHMGSGKMIQVPDGHCMVAGDNLAWSRDSRLFGPLPLGLIKGKVEAKVWPPKVMCWVENGLKEPEYAEE